MIYRPRQWELRKPYPSRFPIRVFSQFDQPVALGSPAVPFKQPLLGFEPRGDAVVVHRPSLARGQVKVGSAGRGRAPGPGRSIRA